MNESQTHRLVGGSAGQAEAARRATAITQAVSALGGEDTASWRAKASELLTAHLQAAALSGAGTADVARWVSGTDPHATESILGRAGAAAPARALAGLRHAPRTAAAIRLVMSLALEHWQEAGQ